MKRKLDPKSIFVGVMMTAVVAFSIGATANKTVGESIHSVRFRVLESAIEQVEWRHGGQVVKLKLTPYYGKISKDSHDWRLKHETQELTLVTITNMGYEINKGDILSFQASGHLKLND